MGRMMRLRLPLYGRVLLLLAANLVLLLVLILGSAGWGSLLSDSARARLASIGNQITGELSQVPAAQWPAVLARFDASYGVRFSTRGIKPPPGPEGPGPMQGPPPGPPPGAKQASMPGSMQGPGFGSVMDKPTGEGPGPVAGRDADPMARPGPQPHGEGPGSRVEMSRSPWFGPYRIVLPSMISSERGPRPLDVIVTAPSLPALLRLLGVGEWLSLGLLAIGLSALLWAPFILGTARAVVKMKQATQRIAEGQFSVRVPAQRGDELGELADSINEMAARLERYVQGQKQFLADVAHETISPLARIQVGLGLMESQLDESLQARLRDVQEDAQLMSDLLKELLLFSRAGMTPQDANLQRINLRKVVVEAAEREDAAQLDIDVDAALEVMAHEALLGRAIANLLRNALRYGGGRIEMLAQMQGDRLSLRVLDRGPGVSEESLARLGEPFFRAEAARDRDSGGYGLGLAIVRRCAEACGGSVSFRNRVAGGFEAELILVAA